MPGEDVAYFRLPTVCELGMIDLTTGLITEIGSTGLPFGTSIAVPEPAASASALVAIAALALLAKRTRLR